MDNYFLTDLFYINSEHLLEKEIQNAVTNCLEDENKLKNVINEKDLKFVDNFKNSLINEFENAQLINIHRAIFYGVKVGMVIQYLKTHDE